MIFEDCFLKIYPLATARDTDCASAAHCSRSLPLVQEKQPLSKISDCRLPSSKNLRDFSPNN